MQIIINMTSSVLQHNICNENESTYNLYADSYKLVQLKMMKIFQTYKKLYKKTNQVSFNVHVFTEINYRTIALLRPVQKTISYIFYQLTLVHLAVPDLFSNALCLINCCKQNRQYDSITAMV